MPEAWKRFQDVDPFVEQGADASQQYQQIDPQPQPAEDPGTMRALLNGIAGGISGNYDEEFAAAMNSMLFGQDYDQQLQQFEGESDEIAAARPGTQLAGEFGGAATLALSPLGRAVSPVARSGGASTLGKMGYGGLEGALYAMLYGSGDADPGERLAGAAESIIPGATIGAVIPGGASIAGKAADASFDAILSMVAPQRYAAQQGANRVVETMDNAGLGVDTLLDNTRKGQMPLQQDQQLTNLARDTKNIQPGEHVGTINNALNDQFTKNNQRVQQVLNDELGGSDNFYRTRATTEKAAKDKFKQDYPSVFNQGYQKAPDEDAMMGVLSKLDESDISDIRQLAKKRGVECEPSILEGARLPTLEEAEIVRRVLAGKADDAYRSGKGYLGEEYSALEQQLKSVLDNSSDDLARVRGEYAQSKTLQEAGDIGLKLASGSMPADKAIAMMDDFTPEQMQEVRRGVEAAMKNQIQSGTMTSDAVRKTFGTIRNQEKLRALWPDNADFDSVMREVENMEGLSKARNQIQGGSQSDRNLQGQRSLAQSGEETANMIRDVSHTGLTGMVGGAVARLIRKSSGTQKMNPEELNAIARILTETDDAKLKTLINQANRGSVAAQRQLENRINRIAQSGMIAGTTSNLD